MKGYFNINNSLLLISCLLSTVFFSCNKNKLEAVETYPDPPGKLVKFLDAPPSPLIGSEGTIVTFNVNGLKGKEGQFEFFINQTKAEVVEVEENIVKVKVPTTASTGGVSILIQGEYYFGPTFSIRGKVRLEPLFDLGQAKPAGPIYGIMALGNTSLSDYFIWGNFSNYNNIGTTSFAVKGVAKINTNGVFIQGTNNSNVFFKMGDKGIGGSVADLQMLSDGRIVIGGEFTSVGNHTNINNIALFNSAGSLDTSVVAVINPDPVANPDADKDTVPTFNGGTSGGRLVKLFFNEGKGITAVGNFKNYARILYERSTNTGPQWDYRRASFLQRMDASGAFDTTFNYDMTKGESYSGPNGTILDAIQLSDTTIVVGNFTTYNGVAANRIAMIKSVDGKPDFSFSSAGGADGPIYRITYNQKRKKILLIGAFRNYNGQPANGLVMINPDGSRDNSFNFGTLAGGAVNYAGQMNNGRVIISGTFNRYNNVVREGLLILNADGSMAQNCNNTGLFRGQINGFSEFSYPLGAAQLVTLVGSFDRFDGKQVNNIIKIIIED